MPTNKTRLVRFADIEIAKLKEEVNHKLLVPLEEGAFSSSEKTVS